jgi:hypothetical protein
MEELTGLLELVVAEVGRRELKKASASTSIDWF